MFCFLLDRRSQGEFRSLYFVNYAYIYMHVNKRKFERNSALVLSHDLPSEGRTYELKSFIWRKLSVT